MNRKFRLIALISFLLISVAINAEAEENTKEYHESWPASEVGLLEISNKFGDIKITDKGGSEVTIDVIVTVEAPNEERARELLSLINVSFNRIGNTVSARTNISSDFKSRQKFSIDYEVNIPVDKDLNIFNKYGNTFVNELKANGNFDIQYGNFTANDLDVPSPGAIELNLSYGKGDIGFVNELLLTVKYSTMNFGSADDLKLESKYTVVNLGKANLVKADSKYDTFNFEEIGSLSADSKYTNIKVDELTNGMDLKTGYGSIRVNRVSAGFDSISIINSYGQIAIDLGDAGYSLDASCEYCGILYPENNFQGDRIKDKHTQTVKGQVGEGRGGTVYIKSRYGQIRLK